MAFDPYIENQENLPPLYQALLTRDLNEAKRLTAEGAVLDELIEEDGNTFLNRAAQDGDIEVIDFYLEHECPKSVEVFDQVQCTPLIWAAQRGHIEAVTRLLSAGADPNGHKADQAGDTAIREAVRGGHTEIVSLLLRAGADPTIGGWMSLSAVDQAWMSTDSTHEVMGEIRAMLAAYPSSVRDKVRAKSCRK